VAGLLASMICAACAKNRRITCHSRAPVMPACSVGADLPQATKRIGATTVELKGSHAPILSHPRWK